MNIDKDIEILEEFTESDFCLYGQEEIIEATKNVLSELQIKNKIIDLMAEDLTKELYKNPIFKTKLSFTENKQILKTGYITRIEKRI